MKQKRYLEIIRRLKLRTKIMSFYTILILFSLGISMLVYTRYANDYVEGTVRDLTLKAVETRNISLELLVNDLSDYSKEIISNQHTQGILDSEEGHGLLYNPLDNEVAESVIFNHKVTSAYIFDFRGNKYSRDKRKFKELSLEEIVTYPWYKEVEALEGAYYLTFNGGGVIQEAGTDYLTMYRIINSNHDHRPIGLLMVNVEMTTIMDALNIAEGEGLKMTIDGVEETLVIGALEEDAFESMPELMGDGAAYFGDIETDTEGYRVSGYRNNRFQWDIIYLENRMNMTEEVSGFNFVFLIIMAITGLTIFYGSIFISKYISKPIVTLTEKMENLEADHFDQVYLMDREDEIGKLGEGYNYMVERIRALIRTTIEEQEAIKEAELRVLMEQVKPHFIYNTLDSISSLIISGRYQEADDSLSALGSFYRASLSNGQLTVELGTEIDIVKNYLFIQKIRYGDLFEDFYEIDEGILTCKVPKLILQPLVENSLYHGIRPIGMEGEIRIVAKDEGDSMRLSVMDNGCGMSQTAIEHMCQEAAESTESKSSVGLPATMQRIKNRYGEASTFSIESNGQGTAITIQIPKGGI